MVKRLIHSSLLPPHTLSALTSQLGVLLLLSDGPNRPHKIGDHLRISRPLLGPLALYLCIRWLSKLATDLRSLSGFSRGLVTLCYSSVLVYFIRLTVLRSTVLPAFPFSLPTVLVTYSDLFSYPLYILLAVAWCFGSGHRLGPGDV